MKSLVLIAPVLVLVATYEVFAVRERGRGWPVCRSVCFACGVLIAGVAVSPAFDELAVADFGMHGA